MEGSGEFLDGLVDVLAAVGEQGTRVVSTNAFGFLECRWEDVV